MIPAKKNTARLEFEMANYLDSPQAVADYLNIVMEENDSEAFAEAMRTVLRAVELGKLKTEHRQSLENLQTSKPLNFWDIPTIFRALGLRVMAQVG